MREENREIEEDCNVAMMDNRRLQGEARWWGPGLLGYKVDSEEEQESCQVGGVLEYGEVLD